MTRAWRIASNVSLLLACAGLACTKPVVGAAPATGAVRLDVRFAGTRQVEATAADVAQVRYAISSGAYTISRIALATTSVDLNFLPPGPAVVTATALRANFVPLGSASASVAIASGATISVTIPLTLDPAYVPASLERTP